MLNKGRSLGLDIEGRSQIVLMVVIRAIARPQSYSLNITDPAWHALLTEFPPGDYSSEALIEQLNLEHYSLDGFRFSASLGEPFRPNSDQDQEYCFKLVAAVINTTQILHSLRTVDNSTPLR